MAGPNTIFAVTFLLKHGNTCSTTVTGPGSERGKASQQASTNTHTLSEKQVTSPQQQPLHRMCIVLQQATDLDTHDTAE